MRKRREKQCVLTHSHPVFFICSRRLVTWQKFKVGTILYVQDGLGVGSGLVEADHVVLYAVVKIFPASAARARRDRRRHWSLAQVASERCHTRRSSTVSTSRVWHAVQKAHFIWGPWVLVTVHRDSLAQVDLTGTSRPVSGSFDADRLSVSTQPGKSWKMTVDTEILAR